MKVPCSVPARALVDQVKAWSTDEACQGIKEECMYEVNGASKKKNDLQGLVLTRTNVASLKKTHNLKKPEILFCRIFLKDVEACEILQINLEKVPLLPK